MSLSFKSTPDEASDCALVDTRGRGNVLSLLEDIHIVLHLELLDCVLMEYTGAFKLLSGTTVKINTIILAQVRAYHLLLESNQPPEDHTVFPIIF